MDGPDHSDFFLSTLSVGRGIAALLLTVHLGCSTEPELRNEDVQIDFETRILEHPLPDFETLLHRSRQNLRRGEQEALLWDLLKIREVRARGAVPALARILAENVGAPGGQAHAAAQALFFIDTDAAHTALEAHLRSPQFNATKAYILSFRYSMAREERNAFLDRYVCTSLSTDLEVQVDVAQGVPEEEGIPITFTIRLVNTTDEPIWLENVGARDRQILFFRSPELGYLRTNWLFRNINPAVLASVHVPPHETREVTFDVIYINGDSYATFLESVQQGDVVIAPRQETQASLFIALPGTYEVFAVIEDAPAMQEFEGLGLGKPWMGRAVSEPVSFDLPVVSR